MTGQEGGNRKLQKGNAKMIDNIDGNNRALEEAIKNAEQAKARLANERKKQNERRRKAENRHKYMMGGIIVKYFPPGATASRKASWTEYCLPRLPQGNAGRQLMRLRGRRECRRLKT